MLTRQTTGYRMKTNDASYLPRHIVAVDTETIPEPTNVRCTVFRHRFRLGHVISSHYRRDKFTKVHSCPITKTTEFWDYIDRLSGPRKTLWVVAHNTLFDLVTLGLRDILQSGRYSLDAPRSVREPKDDDGNPTVPKAMLAIDGVPFLMCLRCASTGGRIVFVDTLNWFRSTLAEIGTTLNLEKLPMPAFSEPDSVWADYCKRDTEVCFHAFCELIKWHRANDLGVFRYTAASQAMGSYRHRFSTAPILFHDNGEAKKLERQGFFGGRTECFRVGLVSEPVFQLDVNSLYPSVMRSNKYPSYLDAFEENHLPKAVSFIDDPLSTIAEVDMIDPPPIYPFREGGMVVYPRGSFRTTLCGPELSEAIAGGWVKSIGRYAVYKTAELFTKYVDEIWAMRWRYKTEGNGVYAGLAKTLLNSLYGKFSQRPNRWDELDNGVGGLELCQWILPDWDTKKVRQYRTVAGRVFVEVKEGERDDTLIAISAFVASYARLRMNEIRAKAGRDNVFYQGVDSVLVNSEGLARLNELGPFGESQLGGLRLNYHAENAVLYNVADYTLGDRQVVAGRAKEYETAADGRMTNRIMNATQSLFEPRGGEWIMERIMEWKRTGEYKKGSVGEGGWVQPLVF